MGYYRSKNRKGNPWVYDKAGDEAIVRKMKTMDNGFNKALKAMTYNERLEHLISNCRINKIQVPCSLINFRKQVIDERIVGKYNIPDLFLPPTSKNRKSKFDKKKENFAKKPFFFKEAKIDFRDPLRDSLHFKDVICHKNYDYYYIENIFENVTKIPNDVIFKIELIRNKIK